MRLKRFAPAVLLASAAIVLHGALPAGTGPAAGIGRDVRTPRRAPIPSAPQNTRLSHMSNAQITKGGAPVNLPQAGGSYYNPTTAGCFQLYQAYSIGGNSPPQTLGAATPVPAAGASVTVAGFVVTNTGAAATPAGYGGASFPVLSVQAATAPVGTTYNLVQTVASSGAPPSSGVAFDVTTPPYTAANYYYSNSGTAAGIPSLSVDVAGQLFDGALFDTATGYAHQNTAQGSNFIYGAVDLGAGPPAVSAFAMTYTSPSGGAVGVIQGSNDGSTWTTLNSQIAGGGQAPSGVKTLFTANQAYRYYLCFTADGGPPNSVSSLTDFRLWDFNGTLIIGHSSAPDTTAPAPAGAGINAAGNGGVLNWTESGSPPVLQAAGQGAAQGLTLTATGGPVTLSAVTTAGTQTSFTTSRAIAQGEALTLAGAAGAFTDSASPPNASAAFGGLAVANASTAGPPGAPAAPAVAARFPTALVLTTAPLPSGASALNLQRAPDAAGQPGAWAVPADGAGVTPSSAAVDSGLTPATTYHYRFAAVGPGGTTYGAESGPVTTGANTMTVPQTAPDPSFTPSGVLSKLGIALETTPGNAVKAARLLDRVTGNLQADNKRNPSKATHNHPGRVRSVLGVTKTDGQITLEGTPESLDEVFALVCGAPVNAPAGTASTATAPAGIPQAPAGLSVLNVGAAGAAAATYTCIARNAQGDSVASAAVTTNTSNAALTGTNFNQVACLPVLTASSYVWLKGGQLLGVTLYPWINDVGQVGSAYVAPAAPAGYVNTYKLGVGRLTASLQENRGGSIYLYGGVSCNKLSLKYEKTQADPFTIVADLVALFETLGWSEAQLGLDTAGTDPLGDFSVAAGCTTYIGGAIADAESWGVDVDSNLGEKHSLRGYTGPAGHFKQGSNHSVTASLYFSSEQEYQRYLGQLPGSTAGAYGASKTILYFPAAIFLTLPANSAGVVNEIRVLLPYCDYEMSSPKYSGKDGAIKMDVTIYPFIDPVTGSDVIIQTVNSRNTIGQQTTSLVTGVPANAVFAYTS